jgi:formylmethanofuran dehydrogenase subunit E
VHVTVPEEDLPGPPLSRVICDRCGDAVQDRREVLVGDLTLCRPCAAGGYYRR